MLRLLKVSGDSLSPTYHDGDFVLIAKIPFFFNSIQPGDVIAFHHAAYGTMIKVIKDVTADGNQITIAGTHINSVDSIQLGPISRSTVIGKVIWQIKRPNPSK